MPAHRQLSKVNYLHATSTPHSRLAAWNLSMSRPYRQVRRSNLSSTAKETRAELPSILRELPRINATESSLHLLSNTKPLDSSQCPGYIFSDPRKSAEDGSVPIPGAQVQVLDDDTLDAAISLAQLPARALASTTSSVPTSTSRVAVLNLASDKTAGGGWLSGALAQEESICYRSSLYLSLHKSYYPLPPHSAIYSPSVVIMRESWGKGHKLMVPATKPADLPVVSVISVAAIRRPVTRKVRQIVNGNIVEKEAFDNAGDRELTKKKMRLSLRIAANKGHTRLILGALGCGAFRNPTEEVAICWREVLKEPEFAGGWWEEIVFAVLDKGSDGDNGARNREGNFATFERQLHGFIA